MAIPLFKRFALIGGVAAMYFFGAGPASAQPAGVGIAAVQSADADPAEQGDEASQKAHQQRLMSLAEGAGPGAFRAALQLRQMHSDLGNSTKALYYAQKQLALAQGPAQAHGALMGIVALNSALHQLSAAKGALTQLEQTMETLRSTRRWAAKRDWWQAGLAMARASYEMQSGHLDKAEQAWQACNTSALAALQSDPEREASPLFLECNRGLLGVLLSTGQIAAAAQVADQLRTTADRLLEVKSRPGVMIRVNQALARLALEQGKFDQAEAIIIRTLKAIEGGDRSALSLRAVGLLKMHAEIEMLRNRWERALEIHRQRESLLRSAGSERGNFGFYSVEYAYTLIRLKRAAEAVDMLRPIVAARGRVYDEDSLSFWEGRAFLGIALAASGQAAEALSQLQAAIPRVLDISRGERSSAESGVLRTARLNWLLDGYINLLAGQARAGDQKALDESFRMADLARGSTVQRALAASATRATIVDPELAGLARGEQDLQREISTLADAIGSLLARGRVAEQDKVVADMRTELSRLRKEHAGQQAEIDRRFPGYAALLNPKPASIVTIQKLLRAGEALVSIYVGSETTLVWAVPAAGSTAFAVVPLGAAELNVKVHSLRKALDPAAEASGRLPKFPFETAHELYRQILAPVEAGWKGAQKLIVVPHGRLGQLPFSVLTTAPFKPAAAKLPYAEMADAPWLIRQVAISQLPAVLALPALRSGRTRHAERPFIGFGDPVFSAVSERAASTRGVEKFVRRGRVNESVATANTDAAENLAPPIDFGLLPALPDTAQEIEEVAAVLAADAKRDIYLHKRASEAQVKKADLAPYRVIMFATHGLMSGEIPGLHQPALALSNPAITGDGDDGMLTMEEILGLKLTADWVVLSACNSAAAGGAAEESVSGLGRAFFYAGAKSLLLTSWAVETESARMLTTEAFRRQATDRTLSRSRALQQSSLSLMTKTAEGNFSYAHPMFWAPYVLVGDGG